MKLILPMVPEVPIAMERSGSTVKVDAPCPFVIFGTHMRNYTL